MMQTRRKGFTGFGQYGEALLARTVINQLQSEPTFSRRFDARYRQPDYLLNNLRPPGIARSECCHFACKLIHVLRTCTDALDRVPPAAHVVAAHKNSARCW